MSEDPKPKPKDEQPAPETPETPQINQAPAVHSDQLWGGPGWVRNATHEPVWCETKEEYFALLNRRGLRMMDQQESTTGPEQPKDPAPPRLDQMPAPPVEPMTQDEAQIYGAITAVHRRYGIVETIWCDRCFARHVHHGCRPMRVTSRGVRLECRCGVAEYRAPTGTTDLVLSSVMNSAITSADKTAGTIMTPSGPEFRPTTILQDMEAVLIKRYVRALRARGKEPRLFHIGCWSKDVFEEDEAIAMHVSEDQIVYVCKCRTLYHASSTGVVH